MNDKNVIVSTDIGHDPDDFFALCYLQSAGVNIRAITITEGDPHQIALVKMFCKEVGLDIPIGVANIDRASPKEYEGEFEGTSVKEFVGFHYNLLDMYGYPYGAKHDGYGYKVIQDALSTYPDSEIFIIGAPKNFSRFLNVCGSAMQHSHIKQVTFQGGFMAYDAHSYPCKRLEKFEGKATCPSYNPNGDIKGTQTIIESQYIDHIRFVSKNVCHTIVYNREIHDMVKLVDTKNRADEMFIEGMSLYLSKHKEKKFHDPCAAVCMLHPEIAEWVRGTMYYAHGGWGTKPTSNSNSETIAMIDENKFWEYIIDRD